MVWLAAHPDRREAAGPLAERTKIPRRYLHKVLQAMVQGGLVDSQPGPGGGYELCVSADEITILDVINTVAPLERIRRCPLGLPSHTQLCPLHAELDRAYAETERVFAGHGESNAPFDQQDRAALRGREARRPENPRAARRPSMTHASPTADHAPPSKRCPDIGCWPAWASGCSVPAGAS